ncbi:hypothetical protein PDE_08829 [Penicillium oxalicum 114-2]|uniref:Uncharacterized protein n=1 Tax=Penicillium oxalicum (strain 114-2 / CGMCC 5302) TaxID=933388 RepID=S8BFK5_PENO1|nr:hypothetical protein PDE_08829 [Penicillium oxalicum 114-2]
MDESVKAAFCEDFDEYSKEDSGLEYFLLLATSLNEGCLYMGRYVHYQVIEQKMTGQPATEAFSNLAESEKISRNGFHQSCFDDTCLTRGTGGRYTDHLMCQLIASDETLTRVLQEAYVLGKPLNDG